MSSIPPLSQAPTHAQGLTHVSDGESSEQIQSHQNTTGREVDNSGSSSLQISKHINDLPDECLIRVLEFVGIPSDSYHVSSGLIQASLLSKKFHSCSLTAIQILINSKRKEMDALIELLKKESQENPHLPDHIKEDVFGLVIQRHQRYFNSVAKNAITIIKQLLEPLDLYWKEQSAYLLRNLERFIPDLSEDLRFEIAKIAAFHGGEKTSEYIQKCKLLSESMRFEMAKIAAAQKEGKTSRDIEIYNLSFEKDRFEIAKIAAQCNGAGTSLNIQNYRFSEESDRLEIAKLAAEQDGNGCSLYIENYELSKESDRLAIAKIAAVQNGKGVSEHIQCYGLTNETDRIEIAILALTNCITASQFIDKYQISNEADRLRLALISAKKTGEFTSLSIEKFQLSQESDRLEVAKIAAANPNGTLSVSDYIQNYHLNEDNRFDVAKIAAKNISSGIVDKIDNYQLTRYADRLVIAKIAAAQSGWSISMSVFKFRLDEEDRFDVAKIAAAIHGEGVSKFIGNYTLLLESHRYEVAKIALNQDPEAFLEYINKYKLTKEHFDELSALANEIKPNRTKKRSFDLFSFTSS